MHGSGLLKSTSGQEGWREIDERDGFFDDLSGLDVLGPAGSEEDAGSEVVAVRFSPRKSGSAVVAGDDDEGVIVFAGLFELFNEDAAAFVEGHRFAEVVGHVFTDDGDIGEEGREFANELIGVEIPEFFAGSLDPLTVGVGGVEVVEKGLTVLAGGEEGLEVGAAFLVDPFFRGFDVFGGRDGLGKIIHLTPSFVEGRTEGLAFDVVFMGEADVVAGLCQKLGVAFDLVPRVGLFRAMPAVVKLRAGAIGEEVSPRDEGRAAGRAGRGGDEGVGGESAFARDLVKGGSRNNVVHRRRILRTVSGGVAAEVIGKEEEDVGALGGVGEAGEDEREGKQEGFHGREWFYRKKAKARRLLGGDSSLMSFLGEYLLDRSNEERVSEVLFCGLYRRNLWGGFSA